jgi:hypothetical protein
MHNPFTDTDVSVNELSGAREDPMSRQKDFVGRAGPAIVIALTATVLSGCGLSTKYSYDVQAKFPDLKTYEWAAPVGGSRQDPVLETNVQFFADRDLGGKGLTRKTDQADLLVWTAYDSEYDKSYELRMLTLYVARADNRQVIWRGTASGPIRTDADSKQVEEVVKGILANFPPK